MKKFVIPGLVLGLLSTAVVAHAATLRPGTYIVPVRPEAMGEGSILQQTHSSFTMTDASGQLVSTVISGDVYNPYGGLTFIYQLMVNPNSARSMVSMGVDGFSGFGTDVSVTYPDPPENTAQSIARLTQPYVATRSLDGDSLQYYFQYGGGLAPGRETPLIVVQTDAANYAPTEASVFGIESASAGSLKPSLVPEPSAGLLTLVGFASLALLRRRGS